MTSIFSPLDDRYNDQIKELQYAGEVGFMKFRLEVEIKYFLEMIKIKNCNYNLDENKIKEINLALNKYLEHDFLESYKQIKEIEKRTKHDVKAVEYFLRNILKELKVEPKVIELVHYGLTSQDINTPALSLQLNHFHTVLYHQYQELIKLLENKVLDYHDITMLARTHGQPAIPTTIGNQFKVVLESIKYHINHLYNLTKNGIPTKFGGAVGHLNAHFLTDPHIDWHTQFDNFILEEYRLKRIRHVTQNLPYTYWSPIFDSYKNLNCVISDFCQDIWIMISNNIFNQSIEKGQVGSSAMPQKINPIDFENSEGNADFAINLFEFFSRRLSRSRLQRDLTDSTILRNLGIPFGHSLLAVKSLMRGLKKITPNISEIKKELENEPTIIAEGLQTILRNEGIENPYEIMREITQENHDINLQVMKGKLFEILNQKNIKLSQESMDKIINLDQFNYTGKL
jgi:adenylosuccinate lyase